MPDVFESLPYRYLVAADFEFDFGGHASFEDASRSGERPRPTCMVAKELRSGQTWRLWRGKFESTPPFPIGPDALFVAYYASAELGCFREMRARILRGACSERDEEILNYCAGDTEALEGLLLAMLPPRSNRGIDLPRALLRGRYMAAAAVMEWNGAPIDTTTLELLRKRWTDIQDDLIAAIDMDYGVYEGRTFKRDRFESFLIGHDIPWPLREDAELDLSRDTFRQMAKSHAVIAPLHELRHALSEMRLNDLAVGHDGRNRTILSAFRAKTSRNQPSNTKFIFGPSVWLRGLIKPPPGHAVAYVDWSNQEVGIAAKLSGDERMIAAYLTGDPYIAFGEQCGKLPQGATKASHPDTRQLLKGCVLGVLLALNIGQSEIVARDLLRLHRETYRKFWQWSDAAVDFAMLTGSLHTMFGWHVHVGENPNPRSLRNFPMQANAAEMMRIAACLATERGVEVCAPVHDAFLICASIDRIESDVAVMRAAMVEASRAVLDGFEIRTDVHIVRYPDRYMDPRGEVTWDRVMGLIAKRQQVVA